MDNKDFKKIVSDELINAGFIFKNKKYYCDTKKLTAVIDLQKSDLFDAWYINYGFYVKDIHEEIKLYPKISECDIDTSFSNELIDANGGAIPLSLDQETIRMCIKEELKQIILPVVDNGVEEFFDIVPDGICLAKKRLKDYLGIDNQ